MKMTYTEALAILKQYNDWRNGKGRMPRFKQIDEAMLIAIKCIESVIDEQTIETQDHIVLENVFQIIRSHIEK